MIYLNTGHISLE